MKKISYSLLFTFSCVVLFANEPIGELVIKQNDVFVIRNLETVETFQGYKLLSKDIIVTGDQSKAKIEFIDKTVVTVGKSSIFEVENYKFDNKDSADNVANFKVKNGFFSAVTGQIGKISPDKFALKTKTATIGVRGTAFEGDVAPGKESLACTKGSIGVTIKGKTIVVNEGESLEIKNGDFVEPISPNAEIGNVAVIDGIVFIIRGDNTTVANIGDKIFANDKIVTSYNSSAQIDLIDKNSLKVLKNSGCFLNIKSGKYQIEVVKGFVEQIINGQKNLIGVKN